jgi:hypothetical protein
LCGHDERHWFVAAVPERASASNVKTAFAVLKPVTVRQREDRLKVKSRKRLLTDNFNLGRRTSVTAANIYGVRGVRGRHVCL